MHTSVNRNVAWCCHNRGVRFGSKGVHIGLKWEKSGTFSDQIQYICATKCTEIWSEKSRISSILSYLDHFGAKPEPDLCVAETAEVGMSEFAPKKDQIDPK